MRRAALAGAWLVFGGLACSDPTGPETPIVGAQLYDQHCARCHGTDGAGVAEQPLSRGLLNDRARMKLRSDMALTEAIRRGKPPAMPAFGDEFTDAKLMVLVAYVRSLSEPSAPNEP